MENIQAFPTSDVEIQGRRSMGRKGMTLRDYFAGEALQAFMSSNRWLTGLDFKCNESKILFKVRLAQECYVMADAMLKEREKC